MAAQPIVNRLQDDYSPQIAFVFLNAADNDIGKASFQKLGVIGHPNVIIFNADGQEIFRTFGLIEEDAIRDILNDL